MSSDRLFLQTLRFALQLKNFEVFQNLFNIFFKGRARVFKIHWGRLIPKKLTDHFSSSFSQMVVKLGLKGLDWLSFDLKTEDSTPVLLGLTVTSPAAGGVTLSL